MLRGILAGVSISLGGVAYLSCENNIIGAALFSIGLLTVLILNFNLFTGKVCYVSYLKKPSVLSVIWLLNFMGAAFVGLLCRQNAHLSIVANTLSTNKITKEPVQIFLDAVLCGVFIAIAVMVYAKLEKTMLAGVVVIISVMCFILTGAEHVVADMFYFTAGEAPLSKAAIFLLITTIGNIVGGAAFGIFARERPNNNRRVIQPENNSGETAKKPQDNGLAEMLGVALGSSSNTASMDEIIEEGDSTSGNQVKS